MKIIISHDVDHLYWNDHLLDTWWLGLILRTVKEVFKSELSLSTAAKRIFPGKNLNNIMSLIDFLNLNNIPATFFFGTRKGLKLSYSNIKAKPFIEQLLKIKFMIGLHGIAFNDRTVMLDEKRRFNEIAGFDPVGIRMHYLRMDNSTYELLSSLGYKYDSSQNKIDFPYKYGNIWSIPISIMDVDVIQGSTARDLEKAKKESLVRIESAKLKDIPYFVINFHDFYFSDGYPVHKAYFFWLIDFLKKNNFIFTSFNQAVQEIN